LSGEKYTSSFSVNWGIFILGQEFIISPFSFFNGIILSAKLGFISSFSSSLFGFL
jgi:hypothetical protein